MVELLHIVQFVHLKEGFTYQEALKRPDGFIILAIFLEIGGNGHALSVLEKYLPQVVKYRRTVKIPNFMVGFSVPAKLNDYYRYDGSFTRPNCAEAVNWIILPGTVKFTQKQLDLLRAIRGQNGKPLGSNVRPTQPLNGRIVYRLCQ
uniref:carbonic anhydrase n=2 Tax=Meloidogyne incognita group TaxID=654580 RepID=A0A914LMX6_MELIC